jgi:hypothetical protein
VLADDERARLLVILELFATLLLTAAGWDLRRAVSPSRLGFDALTIGVDDGPPFDRCPSRPDLDVSPDQRPVGGLGIAIIAPGRPNELSQGKPPLIWYDTSSDQQGNRHDR